MKRPESRLFCWPNRFGFTYFLVFLLMLAVGGTYQNNLVFMMAFILLALGLVTITQTARNIRDVRLISASVEPDDEGRETYATIVLKNEGRKRSVERIRVRLDKKWYRNRTPIREEAEEIPPQSTFTLRIPLELPDKWGIETLGRIQISTTFPYGLFQTWFVLKSKEDVYVYPRPSQLRFEEPVKKDLGDDFSGHKKYEFGEPYARMDWKLAARGKGLNIKQYKSADSEQLDLVFDKKSDSVRDFANRLKSARANGIEWSLKTPIGSVHAAKGVQHYHRSMKMLVKAAL